MDRNEELFKRLECFMGDIKFAKELQWRNVYWAILFFGALIALFQLPMIPTGWCFPQVLAKILGFAVTLLAATFLILYQYDHARALSRYRLQMDAVERMLKRRLLREIQENAKQQCPRQWERAIRRQDSLYYIPFIAAIIASAIIAILVIAAGRLVVE